MYPSDVGGNWLNSIAQGKEDFPHKSGYILFYKEQVCIDTGYKDEGSYTTSVYSSIFIPTFEGLQKYLEANEEKAKDKWSSGPTEYKVFKVSPVKVKTQLSMEITE